MLPYRLRTNPGGTPNTSRRKKQQQQKSGKGDDDEEQNKKKGGTNSNSNGSTADNDDAKKKNQRGGPVEWSIYEDLKAFRTEFLRIIQQEQEKQERLYQYHYRDEDSINDSKNKNDNNYVQEQQQLYHHDHHHHYRCWKVGKSFTLFKKYIFGKYKVALLHLLNPSTRCDHESYTQLIYSSCLQLVKESILKKNSNKSENNNNDDGQEVQHQQDQEQEQQDGHQKEGKDPSLTEAAYAIFSLYALCVTNPLPRGGIPTYNDDNYDDSKTSNKKKKAKKTPNTSSTNTTTTTSNNGYSNSNNNNDPWQLLPVGQLSLENPRILFRKAFAQRIRIDQKHYSYLLRIRERALQQQAICQQNIYQKKVFLLQQRRAHRQEQGQQQQHHHRDQRHENENHSTNISFCCTCGIAIDLVNILDRLFPYLDLCEYTGPVGLESLAGHSETSNSPMISVPPAPPTATAAATATATTTSRRKQRQSTTTRTSRIRTKQIMNQTLKKSSSSSSQPPVQSPTPSPPMIEQTIEDDIDLFDSTSRSILPDSSSTKQRCCMTDTTTLESLLDNYQASIDKIHFPQQQKKKNNNNKQIHLTNRLRKLLHPSIINSTEHSHSWTTMRAKLFLESDQEVDQQGPAPSVCTTKNPALTTNAARNGPVVDSEQDDSDDVLPTSDGGKNDNNDNNFQHGQEHRHRQRNDNDDTQTGSRMMTTTTTATAASSTTMMMMRMPVDIGPSRKGNLSRSVLQFLRRDGLSSIPSQKHNTGQDVDDLSSIGTRGISSIASGRGRAAIQSLLFSSRPDDVSFQSKQIPESDPIHDDGRRPMNIPNIPFQKHQSEDSDISNLSLSESSSDDERTDHVSVATSAAGRQALESLLRKASRPTKEKKSTAATTTRQKKRRKVSKNNMISDQSNPMMQQQGKKIKVNNNGDGASSSIGPGGKALNALLGNVTFTATAAKKPTPHQQTKPGSLQKQQEPRSVPKRRKQVKANNRRSSSSSADNTPGVRIGATSSSIASSSAGAGEKALKALLGDANFITNATKTPTPHEQTEAGSLQKQQGQRTQSGRTRVKANNRGGSSTREARDGTTTSSIASSIGPGGKALKALLGNVTATTTKQQSQKKTLPVSSPKKRKGTQKSYPGRRERGIDGQIMEDTSIPVSNHDDGHPKKQHRTEGSVVLDDVSMMSSAASSYGRSGLDVLLRSVNNTAETGSLRNTSNKDSSDDEQK